MREFQRQRGRRGGSANIKPIPTCRDHPWAPNHFAGFNEHRELEYLVDASLTPREAIAAATSVSAEILGLDKRGTRY